MACWIGSGFCSGQGPWQVQEVDGVRQLVHVGDQGQGVKRKLVHVGDQGQGVKRKLVHVGDQGQGVNQQLVHVGPWPNKIETGAAANNGDRTDLLSYFQQLAGRLRRVRVCCGDWSRVCGPSVTFKHGLTAVFLDPPYADTANRNSKHPLMRIALCGYEGEHQMPPDWDCWAWNAGEGFGGQKLDGKTGNGKRERIWFSPGCVRPLQDNFKF